MRLQDGTGGFNPVVTIKSLGTVVIFLCVTQAQGHIFNHPSDTKTLSL
jgi:hypothetical protein